MIFALLTYRDKDYPATLSVRGPGRIEASGAFEGVVIASCYLHLFAVQGCQGWLFNAIYVIQSFRAHAKLLLGILPRSFLLSEYEDCSDCSWRRFPTCPKHEAADKFIAVDSP